MEIQIFGSLCSKYLLLTTGAWNQYFSRRLFFLPCRLLALFLRSFLAAHYGIWDMSVMGNISHYAHSFSHYAHNLGMSMTETSSIHCLSIKKEFQQFLKEFHFRRRDSILDRPGERRERYPLYRALLRYQPSFRKSIYTAIASRSPYMRAQSLCMPKFFVQ